MKPGRKTGQRANMSTSASYTLTDLDREFWTRVKMAAVSSRKTIRDYIVDVLETSLKKARTVQGSKNKNQSPVQKKTRIQ